MTTWRAVGINHNQFGFFWGGGNVLTEEIIPWAKEFRENKEDRISFWEAGVCMGHSRQRGQ